MKQVLKRFSFVCSVFLVVTFCVGTAASLRHAFSESYIEHQLFRLVLLDLWEEWNKDLAMAVVLALGAVVLHAWIRWMIKGVTFAERNMRRLVASSAVPFCLAGLWLVNRYMRSPVFHSVTLVFYGVFPMLCVVFAVLVIKGRLGHEKLRVASSYARRTVVTVALVVVVMWGSLNAMLGLGWVPAQRNTKNIVIIVVDCLRSDRLGIYGYERNTSPHIDKLAQESLVFMHAYSLSSWTKPSVASLLTAKHPLAHLSLYRKNVLPLRELTMAEILRNQGYATAYINSGNEFISDVYQFDQGFEHYVETKRRNSGDVAEAFAELLPKLSKKGAFFSYIHIMDVHLPYDENPNSLRFADRTERHLFNPGQIKLGDVRVQSQIEWFPESEKDHIKAMYDGQMSYVDENIHKIMQALQEICAAENTIVVITSDHGEEFWDHGGFEHGHTLYDEIVHVPLIIAGSGLEPRQVEPRVRLIDVLPTVLTLAGVDVSGLALDGVNVLDDDYPITDDLQVFAVSTLYGNVKHCIFNGDRKLIYESSSKTVYRIDAGDLELSSIELYDLEKDPGETQNERNLATEDVHRLGEQLANLVNSYTSTDKAKNIEPDEQTKRRLRSLGYLK